VPHFIKRYVNRIVKVKLADDERTVRGPIRRLILSDRNFRNRRVSRTGLATVFLPERQAEFHELLSGSMR